MVSVVSDVLSQFDTTTVPLIVVESVDEQLCEVTVPVFLLVVEDCTAAWVVPSTFLVLVDASAWVVPASFLVLADASVSPLCVLAVVGFSVTEGVH